MLCQNPYLDDKNLFFRSQWASGQSKINLRSSAHTMRIVPSELWTSLRSPFKSGPEESRDFRHWSSFFRLHRKCGCTVCNEDKKVQEFFTKKRYWWTSRTLWKTLEKSLSKMISPWPRTSFPNCFVCRRIFSNKDKLIHNLFCWFGIQNHILLLEYSKFWCHFEEMSWFCW